MEDLDNEVKRRARGLSTGRPLYEAAHSIAEEERIARAEVLQERSEGMQGPLDPALFPRNVFNDDGSRKKWDDGFDKTTPAEERARFEFFDS